LSSTEAGDLPNDFEKEETVTMGGYGSGRWNGGVAKARADNQSRLDIRELAKIGLNSKTFGWSKASQFQNRQTNGSITIKRSSRRLPVLCETAESDAPLENQDLFLRFEGTPCNYGGFRLWFLCPVCCRRVAVLYVSENIQCRLCSQLAYQSSLEVRHNRQLSKAQAIRKRLGGSADMTEPFPTRPKGMHRKTYERLREKSESAYWVSLKPWPGHLTSSSKPEPQPDGHFVLSSGSFLFLRARIVRASAAFLEAFRARSDLSSGVIVSKDRLPPIFPPRRPCCRKNSRASSESVILLAIPLPS
jgi:hypothetical protein